MRKFIILITVLVILAGAVLFAFSASEKQGITGEAIKNTDYYSYTKAICDENKYCQDYEIVCNGNEIIESKPITGAAVQQMPDWEDPRDEKIINSFCNISD